jgi:DNA-binding CsgD family transcriptional regulator
VLTIIGRHSELAALETFVAEVATGPAVLVLEGDAGIGKTTLWRQGILFARQRGYTVVEAQPVEAETKLAFTAIGDLFEGSLEPLLDELPAPQANALRVALALEVPPATPLDQRAISVAVLAVLRSLARSRPLVLAIDDVQWLDPASSAVLAFASRRLRQECVGFLLGLRVGESTPAGIAAGDDRLTVGPLPPNDVHRLIRERLGLTLSGPVFREIYAAAQGNPFYALELCRRIDHGSAAVPALLAIPDRLRSVVSARLGGLPKGTRYALTIVAALGQPTLPLLAAAGSSEDALRPAVDAGILHRDGVRLRFDHPLMATAAYADVSATERMAIHRRLSEIVTDAEERAHHLALATVSPNADIARALELGAARAKVRGATTTAGQLFERAERLTPRDASEDRHRRLVAAAQEHFVGGDTKHAISLFEEAVALASSGRSLAGALAGLAGAWIFEGDQPKAADLLRRVLEEPDVPLAVRADAADHMAGVLFYMREDLEAAASWCDFALEAGRRLGDAQFVGRARATAGDVHGLLGRPLPAGIFDDDGEFRGRVVEGPAFNEAVYLLWTDRLSESAALMKRCRDDALARGDESSLPLILAQLAQVEFLLGRWVASEGTAAEAYELALQAGQRMQQAFALSARALVHAAVGRHEEARADAALTIELSGGRAMGVARIHAHWAVAIVDLSLGRPAEVVRRLGPLREQLVAAGVREPGTIRFLPDEIEALIMLGRLDEAGAVLRWLAERAEDLGRVSARASALRCRGLLRAARGEAEAGLDDLRAAMTEHDRDGVPFERARSVLVLGSLLRRLKRRAEARAILAEAIAGFDALGAVTWRDRGRDELRRIGGRRSSDHHLTPTEHRTATLVAEGLSNKEIAARLFVTARTIETRLGRIYEKIGVHSRTELVRILFGGGGSGNL